MVCEKSMLLFLTYSLQIGATQINCEERAEAYRRVKVLMGDTFTNSVVMGWVWQSLVTLLTVLLYINFTYNLA